MVKARIDDPLDTVAVHCGGGFWGLVFVPWVMYGGVVFSGNGYNGQDNGINDALLVGQFVLEIFKIKFLIYLASRLELDRRTVDHRLGDCDNGSRVSDHAAVQGVASQ